MAFEIPTGTVNGVNAVFTASTTLRSDHLLMVDRVVQVPDLDYTYSGVTITFLTGAIPQTGSIIRLSNNGAYLRSGLESNAPDYSTTALLASIKRRGMLPASDEALTDTDLLALATEELQSTLTALLLSVREEYLITSEVQVVTAGTASYTIPARAVGQALRDVMYSSDGSSYLPLSRVEPERDGDYAGAGELLGYELQGNAIILTPTPSTSGYLKIKYARRPSTLVQGAAVGIVTAINTGTRTVTVDNTPSTFTIDEVYDFVKASPGFDWRGVDLVVTNVSGYNITFSAALPSSLVVGDYLCIAGESPVPQVPVELHPYLAHRVVLRAVEALGLNAKIAVAEKQCERARLDALSLLTPRAEGSHRYVVNRYAPGWTARLKRYRFR